MKAPARRVLPELLDDLSPDDPRAHRSRRDLRRVHYAMATLSILRGALSRLRLPVRSIRVLELGAGDGTLLLRLARALSHRWPHLELTLLDRQDVVTAQTLEAYRQLGWDVRVERAEVLAWTQQRLTTQYDLCLATLFLHHFEGRPLRDLLSAIASRTDAFVACEPRRSLLSRVGSRLIGVVGANDVTRSDAITSVAAGFAGRELSDLWPGEGEWVMEEYPAYPFSHCFIAGRREPHQAVYARSR